MLSDVSLRQWSNELGLLTLRVQPQTFKARMIDLMDQAQHFGGAATSVGVGNDGENGGGDFREGFEATERERE